MIITETLGDSMVHIAKLRTVALIKDDNHMIIKCPMTLITLDECIEFLDGSNDNFSVWIAQLPCQNPSAGIAIRRAFLELVVFFLKA